MGVIRSLMISGALFLLTLINLVYCGYIITTIAGGELHHGDGGDATSAIVTRPYAVALDSTGNIYISTCETHSIRKVRATTGIISTVIGTTIFGYSGDGGPATSATLSCPYGFVVDSPGNVYIADAYNNAVRKVTISTDIINTIAGTGNGSFSGDGGLAVSAELSNPVGVALDSSGNLYIADNGNSRVRKVTTTGIISTFAGTGTFNSNGDGGQATLASFDGINAIAVDSVGNVYIAEGSRIRKVTVSTGIITTIAGTGNGNGDGVQATSVEIFGPYSIALDSSDNVYIADYDDNRIRKVTASTGIISTVAGSNNNGYSGDNGQATLAALSGPSGITVDSAGNVFIADQDNYRIRKVTISTGLIATIAGSDATSYIGDGSAATSANLNDPNSVAVDSSGNIYIADYFNHRVRKVTVSTGIITTIAGTGDCCFYSGDGGPSTAATLQLPADLVLDPLGNIYIADSENSVIRHVNVSTGIISTFAGTGLVYGFGGDGGPATNAVFDLPLAVALDSSGDVYIVDQENNCIRKVTSSTGIITTIAGNSSTYGYSGDGGDATSALLNHPGDITLDSSGNLYITDSENWVIRKVTASTGIISTIVGTGSYGYSGDLGPATSARLSYTGGIYLDSIGDLYIADSGNNRIRKVTASTGIISSVAGSGAPGYSGDGGDVALASLNFPVGIALDSSGNNIYIVDINNRRIRKLTVSTAISTSTSTPSMTPSVSPIYRYVKITDYLPDLPRYVVSIVVPVVILCVVCWVYLAVHHRQHPVATVSFLVISTLSTCDHLSDLFYLLICKYDNQRLLLLSAIFVLLPNAHLFVIIHDSHARPYPLLDYYFGKQMQWSSCPNIFWLWLSQEQGIPLMNRTRLWFTFAHHDSFPKLIIYIVSWLFLLALQALSLIPFVLWLGVTLPIYISIVLLGSFLYQTKLLASTVYWNAWFFLYTGRMNMFDKPKSLCYDTQLLNDSMVVHLFLASIPQVIIKIYNNSLVGYEEITVAYTLSVVMSLLYIVVGLYRYVYLVMNDEKTSFGKLSFMSNYSVLVNGENELVGIPHGTYDVVRNKEVCKQKQNILKEFVCHYEVEGVLSQAEKLITRCFLNEELFMRFSSVVSGGGGGGRENEKSMNKLHEELSNTMRKCKLRQLSSHDLASRAFSLIIRDTFDNRLYSYLKFHGITSAHDLINCKPRVVDMILGSINAYSTKKVVAKYLKLIALNETKGIRDSIASIVESVTPDVLHVDEPGGDEGSINLSLHSVDGSDIDEESSEV